MTRDEAIAKGTKLNVQTLPTFSAFQEQFPDEEACRQHFFKIRWADGVVKCPRCGSGERVKKIGQPWRWQCRNCDKNGYRFSLTTGTVFENTKYPLKIWFEMLYAMLQSKKGVSACQLHRTHGSAIAAGKGDYRTFWYMCQRIRSAMQGDEILKLADQVEIDETYMGGKHSNRPLRKRLAQRHHKRGGGLNSKNTDKIPVIGAIARKGNIIARVIERLDTDTVGGFVHEAVSDKVSLVATDQAPVYHFMEQAGWSLGRAALPHESVDHSRQEYVRGEVHNANIDSFWSLLKRGVMGSFHHVSKKYLPLYVNEFEFRHNHRHDADVFDHVLSSC
jgi:transposase-like protein